jgi:hypothetical protein
VLLPVSSPASAPLHAPVSPRHTHSWSQYPSTNRAKTMGRYLRKLPTSPVRGMASVRNSCVKSACAGCGSRLTLILAMAGERDVAGGESERDKNSSASFVRLGMHVGKDLKGRCGIEWSTIEAMGQAGALEPCSEVQDDRQLRSFRRVATCWIDDERTPTGRAGVERLAVHK